MIFSTILTLSLFVNDPAAGIETTTLGAPGAVPLEELGSSVAMDDTLAAVGAPEAGVGRVYVYRAGPGGTWRHVATLTASDGVVGDRFGASVALVHGSPPHPSILVVGAPSADGSGTERGAAYVFHDLGIGAGEDWVEGAKLSPGNAADLAQFGASVSAAPTPIAGTYQLAIGAPFDVTSATASGAAYLYRVSSASLTLEARVTPQTNESLGRFGFSVSVFGDYAVVGQPTVPTGRAFVYMRSGGAWGTPTVVTPSDGVLGQRFGYSVALAADQLAIGARTHSGGAAGGGAAYVFERQGVNTWSESVRYLGTTPGGHLGEAVSLADKSTGSTHLIVGEPESDRAHEVFATGAWGPLSAVAPFDGVSSVRFGSSVATDAYPAAFIGAALDSTVEMQAGSAYVRDSSAGPLVEDKLLPTNRHAGTEFANSVAADGDVFVVGARGAIDAGFGTGAAFVFEHSGSSWAPVARLTAEADSERNAAFGYAVALDDDTLAVGARNEGLTAGTPFAGGVYVFRRDAAGWSREAHLTPGAGPVKFGTSVALRGDLLAAGAPDDGAGVVHTYLRAGTTWLYASALHPVGGSASDDFGWSLSMADEFLVVGAPFDSVSAPIAGAVHVFRRNPGGAGWNHVQKLTAPTVGAQDLFGYSVAVDDARVVVGAPGNDSAGTNAGAAYVFRRAPDDTFAFEYASLPNGGTTFGSYGSAVALRGHEIAVGAPNHAFGTGAGYLLRWQGFLWNQAAVMPSVDPGGMRGVACAFAGPTLLFGASGQDDLDRLDVGQLQAFDVPLGNLLYCSGKTNSLGCVPFMTYAGEASATSPAPFTVSAFNVIPGELGYLLYGFAKANLGFHGGKLCVKSPVQRLLPPKSAPPFGPPPCDGLLERNFTKRIQSGADPLLTVGQTVFAQWRLRDSSDPAGFGDSLTDGLRFSVCP